MIPKEQNDDEVDWNMIKHAIRHSRDQLGCRTLQKWLDSDDKKIINEIYKNVIISKFRILLNKLIKFLIKNYKLFNKIIFIYQKISLLITTLT